MSEKNITALTSFPNMTIEMIEQFEILTDFLRPAEFRNQLVNLYLQSIINDPDGLSGELKEMCNSFYLLLEFLMGLQEAMDNRLQT